MTAFVNTQESHEDYCHSHMLEFINKRAILRGDFELASGKRSSYYLDLSLVLFNHYFAESLGYTLSHMCYYDHPQAVGGPEAGAIPMVLAYLARDAGNSRWAFPEKAGDEGLATGFFVRKKPKDYGTHSWIEGDLPQGSRVLMLEDVVTTGASLIKAIKVVEEAGGKVVKVISLVDRSENPIPELAPYNYQYIFSIKDLDV